MNRNTFEFDGGMVRFTMAGAVLATLAQWIFWLLVAGFALAVAVLLCLEVAASLVGFHPVWRL